MKYWRGYLMAFIILACTWGLCLFASSHETLMDTVFPYMTRMLLDSLAQWSSGVPFCLWQLALIIFAVLVLASLVVVVVLRLNLVQWFGWVTAAVSLVIFLNTGIYGLNQYTGSISEDVRLDSTPYSIASLEEAGAYFLNEANDLSEEVRRNQGLASFEDFATLTQRAEKGFDVMVYERSASVLAGCTLPVKELGWADYFTQAGVTGITVGITGESAVNPQVPEAGLPFAICHEMAHRMSIYNDPDANFAAFLACEANPSVEFRYSAYLMAYYFCHSQLDQMDTSAANKALLDLERLENTRVQNDLQAYEAFLGKRAREDADGICTLLVNWHIQNVVIPAHADDDEPLFDPTDENQVDLSGLVNAPVAP